MKHDTYRDLIFAGLDAGPDSLARDLAVRHLDTITRDHTAFASFLDLLNAEGGYRPTIRCYDYRVWSAEDRRLLELLADAYDQCMERRGDDRRAYRGQKPARIPRGR